MDIADSERLAGELIERNQYHEAERLLISLVEQGSVYAMTALAWIYDNGCTGNKDLTVAQRLYEQAISGGNTDALIDLGLLLLKDGRPSEARAVFERGAEVGSVGCSAELGWMLANGAESEAGRTRGREMLAKAANNGHLFAQRRMISLDLSSQPSLIKKISLFSRLLVVTWKSFFELYRDRRSEKIW